MSDLMDIIITRRSVRSYKPDEIPRETIFELIDAARWAPSGANIQPWRFIAVTDPDIKRDVARYCKFFFIKSHHVDEAPLIIAIIADSKKSAWSVQDCSMAAQNLMLRAHDLDLGTCFIGAFDESAIRGILDIPDNFAIIGLITVGHPAALTKLTPRLEVKDITSFQTFSSRNESLSAKVKLATKSGPISILRKVLKVIFRL